MARIPPNQYKAFELAKQEADATKVTFGLHTFDVPPRTDYQTNTSGILAVGSNYNWEGIYHATGEAGTITPSKKGWKLTTYDGAANAVMRLVAANIASRTNQWVVGNSTRTSATMTETLKTGAADSTDIGRGIGYSLALTTDSSIASIEIMAGLMSGDASAAGRISSTGPVISAATKGYTGPTDGFYFFFNSAESPNWKACVNYGSTDEVFDTGIPVAASTTYWLSAELGVTGRPKFYLNGNFVREGSAVDAATGLVPCFAVKALSTSAKSIHISPPAITHKIRD